MRSHAISDDRASAASRSALPAPALAPAPAAGPPAAEIVAADGLHALNGAREEDAQVARLFEMTSDLLATLSTEGLFTLLNPAWESALGWSRTQLLSKPLLEFVHPDDVDQTRVCMLSGGRHEAKLVNFTNRFRRRDGEWRSLAWS